MKRSPRPAPDGYDAKALDLRWHPGYEIAHRSKRWAMVEEKMTDATAPTLAPVKPLLRGVSHQVFFFIALITAVVEVVLAPSHRAAVAAAIYCLSLATMFGISALYHRPTWRPRARAWMRRLDHAAIFVLIAGTYTPFGMLLEHGERLLWVGWGGCILGVFQSVFWVRAPKPLSAALYVALGWASVIFFPQMTAAVGVWRIVVFAVGGALYSVGAVVYALRRPNPFPRVFGYHEVFHAFVIAAAICQFVAMTRVIQQIM